MTRAETIGFEVIGNCKAKVEQIWKSNPNIVNLSFLDELGCDLATFRMTLEQLGQLRDIINNYCEEAVTEDDSIDDLKTWEVKDESMECI